MKKDKVKTKKGKRVVSAESFCETLNANVANEKLSDKDFRNFVSNTLPIVNFKRRNEDD